MMESTQQRTAARVALRLRSVACGAAQRLMAAGCRLRQPARQLRHDERGQMTVELLIALPVAIVIACIAFNALTFFGLCAEFDRAARNAVRVYAASPDDNVSFMVADKVQAAVDLCLDDENVEVTVEGSAPSFAVATYTCALAYHPTLFGLGVRTEVLGVSLPALRHSVQLSTFSYDPI